jgi:osmotically-inducible protein OsmY
VGEGRGEGGAAAAFLTASAIAAPAAFAQDLTVDAAETAAMQAALDKDAYLRIDRVHVQTIDGIVYLQGVVHSQAAADRAEALAHAVPGVGEIVDALGQNANSSDESC